MASALNQAELERLLTAGRGLVSRLDLESVLRDVLGAARELCSSRYAALGVLDAEKLELDRFIFEGIDEETVRAIGALPRGHGILGELIRDPKPLRLDEIGAHPHSYGFPAGHPQMTTFLGAPVKIGDEVFGNIYLTEKLDGEPFTERDEEMLGVLSEFAAVAIENARSHAALTSRHELLEQAVRGLRATVDLSRQIDGLTRRDRVFELVTKRGRALLEAEICVGAIRVGPELQVADAAGEVPVDIGGTALGEVASDASRGGSVVRLVGAEAEDLGRRLRVGARDVLIAPLRARGRELGALVFIDPAGTNFQLDHELLLEAFATAAANGIAASQAFEDERARLSMRSSERERRRWARELHDETLQELGALRVLLDSPTGAGESLAARLDRASAQVERIISGLRGLVTELRPAALDELGIEAAVEALVQRTRERGGLAIDLDIQIDSAQRGRERMDPELESAIYRIVQEALSNAVKHASASRVRVALEQRGRSVVLNVVDDGVGIAADGDPEGFGLVGMAERVALLSGELEVGPNAGGGTRVRVLLPLVRRANSAGDAEYVDATDADGVLGSDATAIGPG
ncbi:GAF domain-containing sensor histidine kinase [Thermoleophilia bacterium SCSIO 60948]|nr:GAF domain-containing sensor histidine kinase [Thermoleophilia bacterium SCSIO 60948]